MFCCLYTNRLSNLFQNILGYIPLQQVWAYQSYFFAKVSLFWDSKSSYTLASRDEPFINMPKHAYRNISNTFLHAFLAFGSISKLLHCTKSHSLLPWSRLGGLTQKRHAFTQPLSHKEFRISFLNLMFVFRQKSATHNQKKFIHCKLHYLPSLLSVWTAL